MLKDKRGFTLVELLVTMAIIAVLLGVALVSFRGVRAVARDGQRKTELEEIRSALEVYRTDTGAYIDGSDFAEDVLTPLVAHGYLGEIPFDPLHSTYRYRYYTSDGGITYALCAYLETGGSAVAGCGGGANNCGTVDCNYQVTNP